MRSARRTRQVQMVRGCRHAEGRRPYFCMHSFYEGHFFCIGYYSQQFHYKPRVQCDACGHFRSGEGRFVSSSAFDHFPIKRKRWGRSAADRSQLEIGCRISLALPRSCYCCSSCSRSIACYVALGLGTNSSGFCLESRLDKCKRWIARRSSRGSLFRNLEVCKGIHEERCNRKVLPDASIPGSVRNRSGALLLARGRVSVAVSRVVPWSRLPELH